VIGPAVAMSVLVMLVAGVTLMPAISAVTGRALFWPSRSWAQTHEDGPAARLAIFTPPPHRRSGNGSFRLRAR
jgi:RND superfamily putative drug exporter